MTDNDTVLYEVDARGVASVTLNRPAIGNAYNAALIDGLIETFALLERMRDLRCIVLRGAGRHFQAGADLAFLRHLRTVPPEENLEFSRRTLAAIDGLRHFPHPTLALVQGGCFGGGVGFAAACDIAIAAEDAVFAISEVRWGITAAPIIPLLVDRIGPRALGCLALTGERFTAAEALRIGLVHQLCPATALDAVAAEIIESLLMSAPEAAAMTKQLIAEAVESPDGGAFHARIVAEGASRRHSPEAAEGFASFAEKRRPGWCPAR
jgi:methylglutaconyl-CoA hydratase